MESLNNTVHFFPVSPEISIYPPVGSLPTIISTRFTVNIDFHVVRAHFLGNFALTLQIVLAGLAEAQSFREKCVSEPIAESSHFPQPK